MKSYRTFTFTELLWNLNLMLVKVLPQAFADMIRVAGNLTIDALRVGKVVNGIVIYGLHYNSFATN